MFSTKSTHQGVADGDLGDASVIDRDRDIIATGD